MKQLYIIEYDCAHWCGGSHYCVVRATSESKAGELAEVFMEEHMRELYSSEYNDEYDEETETGAYDNESAVNVISIEPFDEDHDCWVYFCDPSQSEFYPVIGEEQ